MMSPPPGQRANHLNILHAVKLLVMLIVVVRASVAWSLDCVPNGISLSTQVEVDNFQQNHGPCDHVVDYLTIWGDEITSTEGLSELVSVGGTLQVWEATALISLSLINLEHIGSNLEVWDSRLISEIDISSLASVGGDLTIVSTPNLTGLDLSQLSSVGGDMWLGDNHGLTNLDTLATLEHLVGSLSIEGHSNLAQCLGLLRLLDPNDDGVEGPGPGPGGVPDVGGDVNLGANLHGCNSIREIMTILSDGFEAPFNVITELDKALADTGSDNSITIGTDGLPVIAYIQYLFDDVTSILKVAKCLDQGCTAASISIVDGGGTADGPIGIAIASDGLPIVGYTHYPTNAGGVKVAKCNDAACAGGNELISDIDDVGRFGSFAIGVDGLPVIAYQAEGKLTVAKCNDAACSGGDELFTAINDPDSGTGYSPAIAIGSDGFPIISYQRIGAPFAPSTIKVAKCNDPACTGGDEVISVIGTDGGWMYPSNPIAIDADGLPLIAYKGNGGSIIVVKCDDAACAGEDESRAVVESAISVTHLSLAIGQDNFPVISYEDSGIGALKVAKCYQLGCIGENTIATIEDEYDYGPSSVAVGIDGLPIISYHDKYALSLKVAHCESASCQP